MGDSYDDRGVTYIGTRALIVGFTLYCAGFTALVYGANRISELYEAREPVTASVAGPLAPAASAAPSVARPPVHARGQALPRAHAGAAGLICAPPPPCVVRPGQKSRTATKPETELAHPIAPSVRAPMILSVPARSASPAARAVPPAPPVRSATPQAQAARTPAARARQTPAALLVPFTSASGLTSSGALDPRTNAHAPLMVGPARGLGPNPAATPFGGAVSPQQR